MNKNPIEKITFKFSDNASTIYPLKNKKVARVTPHPGQGTWNNHLKGQTHTSVCPSVKNAIKSHMHINKYAHIANK